MKSHLLAAVLSLAALTLHAPSAEGHVYAGIIDSNGSAGLNAGDALAFINQSSGVPISGTSLGVQSMSLVTIGDQAGLFYTGEPVFVGLSNGMSLWGVPGYYEYRPANPYAATSGALIQIKIDSIVGPSGATFSFWQGAIVEESYVIGTSTGTDYWNLTDLTLPTGTPPQGGGVNNPPVDPYGHIHQRGYTVDTPGTYTVSFLLHDANGVQADSAPIFITFATVPESGTLGLFVVASVVGVALLRRFRAHQATSA